MVRAVDQALADHAVHLYLSGKPLKQSATEAGIGQTTLARILSRRGIKARTNRHVVPDQEIVNDYTHGMSELAISKKYGLTRTVVRRRLEESKVHIRGSAESVALRYAQMTREDRKAITTAANAAVRGVPQPEDRLERIAKSREANPGRPSVHEGQFAAWLTERNIAYRREVAVGRYNLDFAAEPIAVEILGGEWHGTPIKRRIHGRRTPYILDQGWSLTFIWATPSHPMTEAVADHVVTQLDETRRDPSLIGEYRVIRGDGQLLARGRKDDYERTGIVPARYS